MSAHSLRDVVAAALALSPVAAFSAPPAAQYGFPDLHFTPPERLAVGSIEIVDQDPPNYDPPRVDHLFPVPPGHAVENWARERLIAAGGPNRLRFTIEEARVNEVQLAPNPAYTDPQTQRYDGEVAARIDIVSPNGTTLATVSARTTRSQGVLASTLPAQREQIWYEMTVRMMASLDRELGQRIQTDFASYLR
jgi:hypothetical protein